MRTLTYQGSKDVRVETVPDPKMKLPDAVQAYKIFDKKEEHCRKVVLNPDIGPAGSAYCASLNLKRENI